MATFGCVPGVEFAVVDGVTVRLLDVARQVALDTPVATVLVTAGSNGVHSGPDDPHYHGHAIDLRSHNFPNAAAVAAFVAALHTYLGPTFVVFLEAAGTPNEHVHAQLRHGAIFAALAPPLGTPRAT